MVTTCRFAGSFKQFTLTVISIDSLVREPHLQCTYEERPCRDLSIITAFRPTADSAGNKRFTFGDLGFRVRV